MLKKSTFLQTLPPLTLSGCYSIAESQDVGLRYHQGSFPTLQNHNVPHQPQPNATPSPPHPATKSSSTLKALLRNKLRADRSPSAAALEMSAVLLWCPANPSWAFPDSKESLSPFINWPFPCSCCLLEKLDEGLRVIGEGRICERQLLDGGCGHSWKCGGLQQRLKILSALCLSKGIKEHLLLILQVKEGSEGLYNFAN